MNLGIEGSEFRRSRWFTRGWTLQELIAPGRVWFYDASWRLVGDKRQLYGGFERMTTESGGTRKARSLVQLLSQITSIPESVLRGTSSLGEMTVAQKMSWAANRETKRIEDIAYSLMGLFDVNMPLLYGEGERAFIRLQEEIIKSNDDQSVFTGSFLQEVDDYEPRRNSLLATSPNDFAMCRDIVKSSAAQKSSHFSMTNKGLHVEMGIVNIPLVSRTSIGLLNCDIAGGKASIALPLVRLENESAISYFRATDCAPVPISWRLFPPLSGTGPNRYIQKAFPPVVEIDTDFKVKCWFNMVAQDFEVSEIYPPPWRGILHKFRSSIWHMDTWEVGKLQQEIIIFRCKVPNNGPTFAVRIDYTFEPDDNASYTILRPLYLFGRAAVIDQDKSLAELLLENGDNPDTERSLTWMHDNNHDYHLDCKFNFAIHRPPNPDGTWILNFLVEDSAHRMEF